MSTQSATAAQAEIIAEAQFDKRLPTYFLLQALAPFLISVIFIPVIPFWILFARPIHRKQYESLACNLTARNLNIRRGFLFKVQKSIPLDKITDLAVNEGPILRYLGLCSLQIETAGGGGQGTNMGQAMLHGVIDADKFRDRVLEQRDRVVLDGSAGGAASTSPSDEHVLAEISETLKRIETKLSDSKS